MCVAHTDMLLGDSEQGVELTMNPRTSEDHAHLHTVLGQHHRELRLRVFSLLEESAGTVTHKAVDLKNWGYTQFVGSLQIGTPPQSFRMCAPSSQSILLLTDGGCNCRDNFRYRVFQYLDARARLFIAVMREVRLL